MKLYIMRGLPGSGKSTLASKIVEKNDHTFRVNMDSVREMLRPGKYDDFDSPKAKKREQATVALRNDMITSLLTQGFSVVCDDTNLGPLSTLNLLAQRVGADIEVVDLRHVSVADCIYRDMKRGQETTPGRSVGAAVINRMAKRYGLENQ